jgi:hypothetical protein
MNPSSSIETRVTALIVAYADLAPTEVDPFTVARVAAAGHGDRGRWRAKVGPAGRGLVFIMLVVALVASVVAGALIAGSEPFRRDPHDLLVGRGLVEPFVGLPPEGVTPSTPETGELVLAFGGRVGSLGLDFHRMWVYADGRLIWKSNLEGGGEGAWRSRFRGSEPTTAVIEQRLTPYGVELLRSEVMSTALVGEPYRTGDDPSAWGRPGVLWGGMTVRVADEVFTATWSDPWLPSRLADPASWLPASAWADQRIGGFVPSRYAVCLQHVDPEGRARLAPTEIWDRLPEPTRTLIRSRAIAVPDPDWNEQDPRCLYQVSTDDASAITEAFEDAGFEDAGLGSEPGSPLKHTIPIGPPSRTGVGEVLLLVVLPNGEVVCHCG